MAKFIINKLVQPLEKFAPFHIAQFRFILFVLRLITKQIDASSSLIGYMLSVLLCKQVSRQFGESLLENIQLGGAVNKVMFAQKNDRVVKHLLISLYHGTLNPDDIYGKNMESADREIPMYKNPAGKEGTGEELVDLASARVGDQPVSQMEDEKRPDFLLEEIGQNFSVYPTVEPTSARQRSSITRSFGSPGGLKVSLPQKQESRGLFNTLFSVFSSREKTPDEEFIANLNKEDPGIYRGITENITFIQESTKSNKYITPFFEKVAINSKSLPLQMYYNTVQDEEAHFKITSIFTEQEKWDKNPIHTSFLQMLMVDDSALRNMFVSWWKALLIHEQPFVSNCRKFKFEPVLKERSFYKFLDQIETAGVVIAELGSDPVKFQSFGDFSLFCMIQWMRGLPVPKSIMASLSNINQSSDQKIIYFQVIGMLLNHKNHFECGFDKRVLGKLFQSILGEARILTEQLKNSSSSKISEFFDLCESTPEVDVLPTQQSTNTTKTRIAPPEPWMDLTSPIHPEAESLLMNSNTKLELAFINLVLLRKLILDHIWPNLLAQNPTAGALCTVSPQNIINLLHHEKTPPPKVEESCDLSSSTKVFASIDGGELVEFQMIEPCWYFVLGQADLDDPKLHKIFVSEKIIHFSIKSEGETIKLSFLPGEYKQNTMQKVISLKGATETETQRLLTVLQDRSSHIRKIFCEALNGELAILSKQVTEASEFFK